MENKLEHLWRKINLWGLLIGMLGILISVIGFLIGLLFSNWIVLQIGISILIFGIITWIFPFIHVTLRMKKVDQYSKSISSVTPVIGRDIKWTNVIGNAFRVLDFDRAGTTIDRQGNVLATSKVKPYGYLHVESPMFNQSVILPIIHRDDFLLAASVYDDPQLTEEIKKLELLVTYIPKEKYPMGFAGISHALHYVITAPQTIDRFYEKYGMNILTQKLEKIFGIFVWDGELRVQVNLNPEI